MLTPASSAARMTAGLYVSTDSGTPSPLRPSSTGNRKPSDEISKPSRRELEDVLDRAGTMATSLGYRLSYWLAPVSGSSEKGGTADG